MYLFYIINCCTLQGMISEFASTTDGDRIAITNMNWSTDIKSDKLCIQISKNVKWSHYKCTDKFYYICQQIIALPTIAYTSLIMSNTVSVIYTEAKKERTRIRYLSLL